jgi:hypothetical protein
MSAMVKPDMNLPEDALRPLRARVFDFVNSYANGDRFDLPGQEPYNVIRYQIAGDEYRCAPQIVIVALGRANPGYWLQRGWS